MPRYYPAVDELLRSKRLPGVGESKKAVEKELK